MEHIKKTKPIKPQDLRIGNLVHLQDSDYCNIFEIDGILLNCIKGRFKNNYCTTPTTTLAYDEIDGIPLTEEILKRVGFQRLSYLDENFNKVQGCLEMSISGHKIYAPELKKNKIEYLHQLQNYIFALYREKLDVNLKDL